ncbi:MAG: alpha-glucosidase/alpha-galactosidase [Spirochaetes bacterium]|nr:alpha-glucosidase/alpha-galactosidase [Spirochaetota bacterium]
MAKKIAFIGAGSFIFTRNLVRDLLTFEAFKDATLVLMDIDDRKLAFSKAAVDRIVEAGKYPAKVVATKDRAEALTGADGVVITILQGGAETIASDIEIPMKHGVDINVGDTRGPSGIFRALRTAPVMLEICADIMRLAPRAIVLNYTNPMAMLCRAMQGVFPTLSITGLCHSVQGTARMLAKWIGAPNHEITYRCAGINHQAWYLEYKWKGVDAYPLLKKAVTERKEIYDEEQVRNEMYLHLDYYVTESSGHNSEYCAWFRKRPDLIEKYCTHGTGWNPGVHGLGLTGRRKRAEDWEKTIQEELAKPVALARGEEYAAPIFNAVFGDRTLFEFNGNVRNHGLIENLPEGCCVEVPVLASPRGLDAMHVGPLPAQLAVLNNISARCEELAVEAALEGDPRKVFHACLFDPLTSAVLGMQEIKDMVNEMFAASAGDLPQFKGRLRA